MQSALTDGIRNTARFPAIPLLLIESVMWSGTAIVELNLVN